MIVVVEWQISQLEKNVLAAVRDTHVHLTYAGSELD